MKNYKFHSSNSKNNSKNEAVSLEKLTQQIAKGGSVSFFGRLFGKGINFLTHILLTHILGAADYGLYALGFNVIDFGHIFSLLGLQNGVVRFGSIYRGEGKKAQLKGVLFSVIFISFGLATLVSILVFALSDTISIKVFNEPRLSNVIKVFSFALPFYTLITITAFSARTFRKMGHEVGIKFVSFPISKVAFIGISFILGFKLYGVVYAFLISAILSAVLGIYLLWKIFPDLTTNLKPIFELKPLIFYSLAVMLIGFCSVILAKIDRIMLGIYGLAKDVGIYNAAAVVATQGRLFLLSFSAIFSPIIADLYNKGDIKRLHNLFKITTKWIFGLTLPFFIIFLLYPKQIMNLFGHEFIEGWIVLIVLGSAQLLSAAVGPSAFILTMTGRQKIEIINNLLVSGLNIGLNIIFIQKYGILGAAIATGISIGMIGIIRLLQVYYLYKIHPYKFSFFKYVIAGVTGALSCIILNKLLSFTDSSLILGLLTFGVIYTFTLILIGFEREDKVVLKALKKRFRGINVKK